MTQFSTDIWDSRENKICTKKTAFLFILFSLVYLKTNIQCNIFIVVLFISIAGAFLKVFLTSFAVIRIAS